jgi:hypothetical protein
MAYALFIIGAVLILTGAKDTYKALGSQLYTDFVGSGGGFVYWLVAVGIIGAVGYYAPWKTFSRVFIILLIIVFIVANKGVFAQLQQALQQGPIQAATNTPPLPDSIPLHLSGLGGSPIPIKLEGQGGGAGGLTSMLGGGGGGGITSALGMFGG